MYGRHGDAHPRWKGGLTRLQQTIRNSYEYTSWRDKIYKRDQYTCIVCGKQRHLQAHHVKAMSIILRNNGIKSFDGAIKCDEIWDVNNGQTLCETCHVKTDNYASKAVRNG
jgi:5-methylcytosine-specific restriction endonuclease McrA